MPGKAIAEYTDDELADFRTAAKKRVDFEGDVDRYECEHCK